MDINDNYQNFRLAHQLKNRVRLVSPVLKNDFERAYIFEILLKKRPEIKQVRSVFALGSVVIEFDSRHLPIKNLLILADKVLLSIAQKSAHQKNSPKKTWQGPSNEVEMAIQGMTCASCALLIEMVMKRHEKVKKVNVNFATETITVWGGLNRDEIAAHVAGLGYEALRIDTLSQRKNLIIKEQQRIEKAKKRLLWASILTAPVVTMAMMMVKARWAHWLQFGLTTAVVFGSGRQFFDKALRLAKQRSANMDSLIALGVGAAYIYSLPPLLRGKGHLYFEAASAIISFVLLGRYLEEKARGKAGEAIRKLVDLQPQTATLLCDGVEKKIDVDEIKVEDILLVKPGEKIPTDGVVVAGLSTVEEAMVTGESMPVVKQTGDAVIGGCVNGNGALQIRATAVGMDTVLAGIVHMVDHAQASKLPIQKQVDKISAVFVPAVMAISGLTFSAWLLVGAPLNFAVANAITVLLIACPCALGLATPAAIMVGSGRAADKGVYIRNGESLEVAAQLNAIVFDKTGTITEGKPKVAEIFAANAYQQDELLALAAAAERNSEHFLGKAIVEHADEKNVPNMGCEYFYSETGSGIKADVNGKRLLIGNDQWLSDNSIAIEDLKAVGDELAQQGKTPVYIAVNGELAGIFAIADKPRLEAAAAIAHLRQLRIESLMVTGDAQGTARYVAEKVGIDRIVANAKPDDKLEIIRQLQQQGKKVGMIGDGINDAPALAAADVGFAIGSGTDIAIESADLTLVQGEINKVADTISLSADTIRVIKQNLFWAFGYNTIAIPVFVLGRLNPMIASAAMALSSVSVIVNSLRLSKK